MRLVLRRRRLLAVLGLVVLHGGLDGVLGQDRAVDLTGGSASSSAICVFLIVRAWSSVLPLTHSVTSELEAMAEPQP